jgi:hypothetical protein
MCQCGCSEFYRRFKLPGPDEFWWVIEISHGCRECSTPAGIIVSRLGAEHKDELEAIPELKLAAPKMFTRTEFPFIVADPGRLCAVGIEAVLRSHGVADEHELPDDVFFDADEFKDDVYRCFEEEARKAGS